MKNTAIFFLCFVASLASQAQRGTVPVDQPAASMSPLEGNWHLTGNMERNQLPALALMIHVDENQISATGEAWFSCGSWSAGETTFNHATGEIAADGSFTLNSTSSIQITITGKAPERGAAKWAGTYRIAGRTGAAGCVQTGRFKAVPLKRLAGTFTGQLKRADLNSEPTVETFSLNVAQGEALTHILHPGSATTYIPVAASIDLGGLDCSMHGQAESGIASDVSGDQLNLKFDIDGAELYLSAIFSDVEENALVVHSARVKGGACDGQKFTGTLNKQN